STVAPPSTPVSNPTFQIVVTVQGPGRVTSTPAGIDCGSVCTSTFSVGTTVDLNATPDAGWELAGFSGSCSGLQCSVQTIVENNVTATFTPVPLVTHSLSV